jgi:hypothetical protein
VFSEQLESPPMPAQDRRKCPSKGPVVQTPVDRLYDDLVPDQGQTNFTSRRHVHRRGEVSGEQDTQTSTDPFHAPSERHEASITCV